MIIGILVPALLVCGGIIKSVITLDRDVTVYGPDMLVGPTARPSTSHPPVAAVSVVDGGPESSFDLPVGTGVRFSDQDGTWIVALVGVERIDECGDVAGSAVPVVVFDIQYQVIEGGVSVSPMTDFALVLADGTTVRGGLPATCAEPPLDYAIIFAGEVHRGRIAVELPAGVAGSSGKLVYGQMVVPTASWTVP